MKYLFYFLSLPFLITTAMTNEFSGVVLDAITQAPIESVLVSIKDTVLFTYTDENGKFHLQSPTSIRSLPYPVGEDIKWNSETRSFSWNPVLGGVIIQIVNMNGRHINRFSFPESEGNTSFKLPLIEEGVFLLELITRHRRFLYKFLIIRTSLRKLTLIISNDPETLNKKANQVRTLIFEKKRYVTKEVEVAQSQLDIRVELNKIKPKALFIDGANHHDWQLQDPYLIKILQWSEVFSVVDRSTSPPGNAPQEEWDNWRPKFNDYDVILQNVDYVHGDGRPWPDEVKEDFIKYIKTGGGLVSIHAGIHGFNEWTEMDSILAMLWRETDYGCTIHIGDNENIEIIPAGTGGGAKDRSLDGPVTVLDPRHPITEGMPKKYLMLADQTTPDSRGPCEMATPLDYVWNNTDGFNGPVSWVVEYHQGRSFVICPIHVWPGTSSDMSEMHCVGFQTMWIRGTEWAATGEVSYPVPDNFPTESQTSTNDLTSWNPP